MTGMEIERHFWLTRSVARTIGLNLGEALASGRLTPEGYSIMIARCCKAGCSGRCSEWLGQQSGGQADAPPLYCAHVDQFRDLHRF